MPKKVFNGTRFVDEVVSIDNAVFLNCHFEHCTLRYFGGVWRIEHCSFGPDTTFSFGGPAQLTQELLLFFDMIKPSRFAEPSQKKPDRVN